LTPASLLFDDSSVDNALSYLATLMLSTIAHRSIIDEKTRLATGFSKYDWWFFGALIVMLIQVVLVVSLIRFRTFSATYSNVVCLVQVASIGLVILIDLCSVVGSLMRHRPNLRDRVAQVRTRYSLVDFTFDDGSKLSEVFVSHLRARKLIECKLHTKGYISALLKARETQQIPHDLLRTRVPRLDSAHPPSGAVQVGDMQVKTFIDFGRTAKNTASYASSNFTPNAQNPMANGRRCMD